MLLRVQELESKEELGVHDFKGLAENHILAAACKEFLSNARADEIVAKIVDPEQDS
jgi:hypothetical protein